MRNSSFQENAKTKVYALEDSLGVHMYSLRRLCNFLKIVIDTFRSHPS